MKKHILGLAIFSLIIGVSVFLFSIFFSVKYSESTYCPINAQVKVNKENSLEKKLIKQAVLNVKTNQLTLEFQRTSTGQPIALHFFVKDSSITKYNFTEYIFTDASRYSINLSKLSGINYHNNLYVIAEVVSTQEAFGDKKAINHYFDEEKAVSVLYDFNYSK